MQECRVGVDIGGTFTDIVLVRADGTLASKKVLSTPEDYSRAIAEGLGALFRESGTPPSAVRELVHGTTIATNTIIERKGARVGLVTTLGFRDLLEIGRFRSPRLYDLDFRRPPPLVPRELRFELPERISGKGEVVREIDLEALDRVAERLIALEVEAVAVCLVNAHVNPAHERIALARLRERLPAAVPIATSTGLLPQIQEYERTSTTVVNAYIRPVIERYVASLERRLAEGGIEVPLMIMQSSGGILPGSQASRHPVCIIESGPAAGVVGVDNLARRHDLGDVMVLDVGGTTAKASIIKDGAFTVMPEAEVGGDALLGHRLMPGAGFPVQVPTIDIAEVGAGGGSIAHLDAAGGLLVGPESAGSVPGPVCYGRGGREITTTDANLLLGYLNPEHLAGGEMPLDREAAVRAMADLAGRVGLSPNDLAWGIHRIANATMMRALRSVSSERGQDPAAYTLVAIGGNGGVHAGDLAEGLGIVRILVPPAAGLFSALGLLAAAIEHRAVQAFYRPLDEATAAEVNDVLEPMVAGVRELLAAGGFHRPEQQSIEVLVEMRYAGQASTLALPLSWPLDEADLSALPAAFDARHRHVYDYDSPEETRRLVALEVIGRGLAEGPRLPDGLRRAREHVPARSMRQAWFGAEHGWIATPVVAREALGPQAWPGPLIIEEYDTTSVVRPGWSARLAVGNSILLERAPGHEEEAR